MPGTDLPLIDYSARTYATVKAALLDHVKVVFPNDWLDFSESSLGICYLELVAYVCDNLSFYLDRTANEMFLATAQQRQSIINLAKLIGYTPRTASAASVYLKAILQLAQPAVTAIPAYTTFTDKGGTIWELLENVEIPTGVTDTSNQSITSEILASGTGTTFAFSVTTDNSNIVSGTFILHSTIGGTTFNITARSDGVLALPYDGTGIVDYTSGLVTLTFNSAYAPDNATSITADYDFNQPIMAYQGRTRLDTYSSTGLANQSYTLTNPEVLLAPVVGDSETIPDPNRFEVWVGDPAPPFGTSTGVLWSRVESLVSAISTDRVYQLSVDDDDMVTLEFGDGTNGAIPAAGTSNIYIIYRTGGGIEGNISTGYLDTTVTGVVGLVAVSVKLSNYEPGVGGDERESADEIRVNAPAYLRTNDTVTTEDDYNTLASQYSNSALGSIARAKARVTPHTTFLAKTVHSVVTLTTVPGSPPSSYYLKLPGSPAIVSTISVSYTVGTIPLTATATDAGGGLATLAGPAPLNAGSTKLRHNVRESVDENPATFIGDGSDVAFSGNLLYPPVIPGTLLLHYTVGGQEKTGYDNGAGVISGPNINSGVSTIDYVTGAVSLTFTTAPDNSTFILFDYDTGLYIVFTSPPDVDSNITITMDSGPTQLYLPSNNVEVYTWAYDSNMGLVAPSDSLKDHVKSYLDLRRVLGTSVQVMNGFNVKVHIYLDVEFTSTVDSAATTASIVSALESYFTSVVSVAPGEDVPLAGIYNAIYPLVGVDKVVVTGIGLRVPVGTGDSATTVFRDSTDPGEYVSSDKLPAEAGTAKIKIYAGDSLLGSSNSATPVAALSGSGLISGSFFNVTTGDFEIRTATAPLRNVVVSVDYFPDEVVAGAGLAIWNTAIEPWEIAVLGDVYIDGVKVN